MHRAVENTAGAPGLIEFGCWVESETGRLLGVSRWESREAFQNAVPLIAAGRGGRQPEWSVADDELLLLSPA
jgi:hypothetical protein